MNKMIRSFLLLSSCIAAAFSAGSLQFTKSPEDVNGFVGESAVMAWDYDLGGNDLLGIRYEHIDTEGQFSIIMNIDANGNVLPETGFPHASFTPRATLTLNPLQDSDVGDVKCTIYRTQGVPVSDLASITTFPANDQKDVIITLTVLDQKVECGQQTIDSDEKIKIEILVESDSGVDMEVNAFQKCGEGQENQIGPECTKGSGVCTFGTTAACDGFTEGLVTIRATVKHPASAEPKKNTCSYTVQVVMSNGLEYWVILLIVIGVLIIIFLILVIVVNVMGYTCPDRIPSWLRWAACCKKQEPTLDPEQPRLDGDTKKALMKGGRLSPLAPNKVVPDETANQESGEEKKKKKKRKKEKKELQELSDL